MNYYDTNIWNKCTNYLNYYYGNEIERASIVPLDWVYIEEVQANHLNWKWRDMQTFSWCKKYISDHKKSHKGGSNRRNSRKRQSKTKNLRLRKVSTKY
jgi:hypothetical protein